jgi:hypothetical protein
MMEKDPGMNEKDLSTASSEAIELLMDESADGAVFEEIFDSNQSRPEIVRLLYGHTNTPDETRAKAAALLNLPVPATEQVKKAKEQAAVKKESQPKEKRTEKLVQRVQRMGVSEKVKLAMRGGSEIRGLLIRDSNKQVIMSVLDNPKITDSEIEAVARNRSMLEDALRVVARNREWTKNYSIQLALVQNPKTPTGLAMGFVTSLKKKDLKQLEKNKNVSEAVRSMAKKMTKKTLG